MIRIIAPDTIGNDSQFIEKLRSWIDDRGIDHVLTCVHEGAHVVYSRDLGFEPVVYGPSDGEVYFPGVGWRVKLGSVEGLPREITLTADPLLVAKQYLGPVFIEQRLVGEQWRNQLWKQARGDLSNYNRWFVVRHHVVGDVRPLSSQVVREAVHQDLEQPRFRQGLLAAAREYEARVLGPMSPAVKDSAIGESQ